MMLVPTELRPSIIHGIGTFLLAPVKKDELVWRFDARIDRVYTDDELNSLPAHVRANLMAYPTWNDAARVWVLNGDNGRYFNHAEQPSTKALSECRGFNDIAAARDLAAGEELTSDYREICDMARMTGKL